ncbi:hypothetical protein BO70DRAFT_153294 [Aspergillus heteromorphus CBS 117.55]|uniref:Uncharacterized protein n=1 Tax=Aspergillus heteromorphus CBS 117.55 TaxID=1448321 RepID=A0A317V5V2_9EURO|nr:uncharacterized protein BO70DRAFT_153294 [Aspergillus heteromorphus CBS 117.55]PWY68418.1 hypothetical protein BO70DRAFT_153294 [Aspergillus heteromorphus CBS 117.55]
MWYQVYHPPTHLVPGPVSLSRSLHGTLPYMSLRSVLGSVYLNSLLVLFLYIGSTCMVCCAWIERVRLIYCTTCLPRISGCGVCERGKRSNSRLGRRLLCADKLPTAWPDCVLYFRCGRQVTDVDHIVLFTTYHKSKQHQLQNE